MFKNRNYSELPAYIPKVIEYNFDCSKNILTNLIGAPETIGGSFICNYNKLTSLIGISKFIGKHLYIEKNPVLDDVSDVWNSEIHLSLCFDITPTMAILPLVKFTTWSGNVILQKILDKNWGSSKLKIIDLQYDLIENGYEDNAKWKP